MTAAWRWQRPREAEPLQHAARFLRAAAVDIVGFCEIEGRSTRTGGVDQLALLAQQAGLEHYTFFPTFKVGAKINQGNAIAARFPLGEAKNHSLPGTGEPRFLSEASLNIDGIVIKMFVTHLSLRHALRTTQIHRIAQIINQCDRPTILAGDFNVSREAELNLLAESHLQKALSAKTFPSWRPVKFLDHLFFSRHFTIVDSYVFDRVLFSDHLPFIAEIRLERIQKD